MLHSPFCIILLLCISQNGSLPRRDTRQRVTFTSSYITRSLGHDLDLVGQPFDCLETIPSTAEKRLAI